MIHLSKRQVNKNFILKYFVVKPELRHLMNLSFQSLLVSFMTNMCFKKTTTDDSKNKIFDSKYTITSSSGICGYGYSLLLDKVLLGPTCTII